MLSKASATADFPLLIRQAIRQGELYWGDLLSAYLAMAPAGHPRLADDRMVDIDAVCAALQQLPEDFFSATRLMAVPVLAGFEHEDAGTCAGARLGRLGDGSLIVELGLSSASLMEVAAVVCCVLSASQKARRLLPSQMIQRLAGTSAATDEDEPHAETGVDAELRRDTPDSAAEEEGAVDPAALIAHVAFAWGTEQTTLTGANTTTGGRLLEVLLTELDPPIMEIHPSCRIQNHAVADRQLADALLGVLAETGLIGRSLHLWLGPSTVVDILSPYCRDLREVLSRWALAQPDQLAVDLAAHDFSTAASEDLLYGVAANFMRTDPALAEERARAEASVGIRRLAVPTAGGSLPIELIDLGRLDCDRLDARLGDWRAPSDEAWLRLPLLLAGEDGGALPYLVEALAHQIRSITLVLPGVALGGAAGTLGRPPYMIDANSAHKISLDRGLEGSQELFDDVLSYADSALSQGPVLSVASARLTDSAQVSALRGKHGLSGVVAGGGGWHTVAALQDLQLRNGLPSACDMWFVGHQLNEFGLEDLATTHGLSALAIASVRHRYTPAEPSPTPPEPSTPPVANRRTIRIRA